MFSAFSVRGAVRSHWKMIDRRLAWIWVNKTEEKPHGKWKVFFCGGEAEAVRRTRDWGLGTGVSHLVRRKVYLKTN